MDRVTEYALSVACGDVVAGEFVRFAAERHLKDLENVGKDWFPWVWNKEKAYRIEEFFRKFLRHVKGHLAGQPIELRDWQIFILGSIFGWVDAEGLRRYRRAYVQVGRGNGKSTMLSGLGLYMLMADGEDGAEVYAAATKKDQARIVFDAARAMVVGSPPLLRFLEPKRSEIEYARKNAKFMPLSKDVRTLDGLAPHLAIIDEYHAHRTRDVYDVLVSALGKRRQPLLFVITTAGFDLLSPAYEEYKYVTKVLKGEVSDEQYFGFIAHPDEGDDYGDEKAWAKANPLLITMPGGRDYLEAEYRAAMEVPSRLRNFLTKNLNLWVDMRDTGYIDVTRLDACKVVDAVNALRGKEVFVGIDLSSKVDLTSVSIIAKIDTDTYYVHTHSFVPEESLARRGREPVAWHAWERLGWITIVPGAVIDHRIIVDWIDRRSKEIGFKVLEIDIDPWQSSQFSINASERGYIVVEVPQQIRYLSEPTKKLRELILEKKLVFDGSPVFRWALGNAVEKSDASGNIMLAKDKSIDRIDPIAATITALARALRIGGDPVNAGKELEIWEKIIERNKQN